MSSEQSDGLAAILVPSREQAVKDGYLVELFEVAGKDGAEISVALTLGAVFDLLTWDLDEQEAHGLAEERQLSVFRRRLSQCAGAACIALAQWTSKDQPSEFRVLHIVQRSPLEDGWPEARSAAVEIEVHHGDHGETVITVSRLGEYAATADTTAEDEEQA